MTNFTQRSKMLILYTQVETLKTRRMILSAVSQHLSHTVGLSSGPVTTAALRMHQTDPTAGIDVADT